MKSIVGVAVGLLLALAIACGGSARKAQTQPESRPGGGTAAHAELDALDRAITADMQTLQEPRPAPPVAACVENCAQALSGAATTTSAEDPTCKPGASQTCSDSCSLKESICKNAGKICSIAADLGGNDKYANDVCNRGSASCEAAKKRCCSCL